jgi:excisionase family DNA binding protein
MAALGPPSAWGRATEPAAEELRAAMPTTITLIAALDGGTVGDTPKPPPRNTGSWLLTQSKAAKLLGISPATLLSKIKAGRQPYVKIGRRRKFEPDGLTAYIERQRRGCDGDRALSRGGKGRRTGTKIFRLAGVGFEDALKRTTTPKPKS